jgi:hypothetical protein
MELMMQSVGNVKMRDISKGERNRMKEARC